MALRKLLLLDAAEKLDDLRIHREINWKGLSATEKASTARINDQWRVCFRWEEGDAYEVEIVDDH